MGKLRGKKCLWTTSPKSTSREIVCLLYRSNPTLSTKWKDQRQHAKGNSKLKEPLKCVLTCAYQPVCKGIHHPNKIKMPLKICCGPKIWSQFHVYCKESKKASFGESIHIIKFHCWAVLVPEALGKLQISGKLCKVSLFYSFSTVFLFNPFSNILTVKENKLIGIGFPWYS